MGATTAPAQPSFAPWIINTGSGYPYQDYLYGVPFSAWDMETTPPTRLSIGHFENNAANALLDGRYWPGLTNVDNGDANGPREMLFIFKTPYSTTANPALTINLSNSTTPMMWVFTCARRNDNNWASGDQWVITANHVNSPAHTFSYVATKPTIGDVTLAKADVAHINVYPNPYVGFNPAEINKYARFVTFNHLPIKATIRIFNLAGVLIKTVQKNDQFQTATWDLKNEAGFPASAGMYIAYIDMPDLGVTKTLKLGIIPEQQTVDRW